MKNVLITTTAAAALIAGLAPSAMAQEPIQLDTLSATANLDEIDVSRTGNTVEIVTGDDLKDSGELRLTDVLSRLPGVTIRSTGPMGTRTGILIRGASQNYVSVYVDGIEVTDPSITQSQFDFGGLGTSGISRIEVLKGSQSALYGSEAIGGVINITTNRATEIGTEQSVELELGSYDSLRASYNFAAKAEDHELAFNLTHTQSDGFSAADENDGNTEADGFDGNRATFYGHKELENGTRIGFAGFVEEYESDFDEFAGAGGDGTPGDEYNDNQSWGLRGFVEFATGDVENKLNLTYTDFNRVSTYNGFPAIFDGTRAKLAYQGSTDLGATTMLAFGADLTRETAQDNFGFSADNNVAGLFGELVYSPTDRFDLTASIRHDDHSEFGGYTTGRLSAAFRPTEDVIYRAALGTGFRAPSLYELYSGFGDPTLTPETSLSAELGVEKKYGERGSVRATLFYLEVEDLIAYDFAAVGCAFGPGCYAQVPGMSRRSGIELETEFAVSETLALGGSYTYTDSATSATSSWATVPRHDIGLWASHQFTDALSGTFTVEYAGSRPSGLSNYTVAHANFTYSVTDDTQAYLRVENVFDTEYQTVSGYGTSDRAFYVGLRKNF
ncbi:TonB-dependent receptor plug domain-containing protein [Actibacterium sp. XHP0104]|uniref:TonB-dependent receptor plug domain-containing protein n=1 Tax=Actibacterium sp. XHP0104 TaxID=2984335 RepID=UPI0021E6EB8E|nr:TonB-dependent receptor [Actibacterium sp. XHP0104]MCV2881488.1 TonB-dependent receptor [Actibacterium sp. XHP0104]